MSYFCFIEVREGAVPEFRALPCDDDSEVPRALADALQDWSAPYSVEVLEGERCVMRAVGPDAAALRCLRR